MGMDSWMKPVGWGMRCATVEVLLLVWVAASTSYGNEVRGMDSDVPAVAGTANEQVSWKGEVSLGYDQSSGNTEQEQVLVSGGATRTAGRSNARFAASALYSSSAGTMDAQRWDVLGRYELRFQDSAWHSFYEMKVDHDRFADVDYRVVPSLGVGRWLADTPDWKALVEVGAGHEKTHYRENAADSDEWVSVARVFLEKRLWRDTRVTQDISVFPSLGESGQYRGHSETALTNPLSSRISLRVSYVVDHDSDPPAGIEEADRYLIASLLYGF